MVEPVAKLLSVGQAMRVGPAETVVERRAGTDERPVVRLGLAHDRTGVEALRGLTLEVERADAPALGEDEVWEEDVVGLEVLAGERSLGRVRRIVPLPSVDALELEDGSLIPMVRDAGMEIGEVVRLDERFW